MNGIDEKTRVIIEHLEDARKEVEAWVRITNECIQEIDNVIEQLKNIKRAND